jgi:hypothetical protein
MPIAVFDALRNNISSLLGGAAIDLVAGKWEGRGAETGIGEELLIEGKPFLFTADRDALPFTTMEKNFCLELMTAFAAMYSGFRQEGYAAHFRTALLASIMDITVARSLRGDHRKGFWPIQQLVQLLKNLSYQRYEGKPATSGFLVYRTTFKELRELLKGRQHSLVALEPRQEISATFFENPLTYRYIDGENLFFTANITMQVTGIMQTGMSAVVTDVERLTQREIFSLVRLAGPGAFAVTVNEASEIEVLVSPAKILVRRKGHWAIFDPDVFRSFLAGCIDALSADDLLWTVYALSKSRYGTVILIHHGTADELADLKKGSVGGADPIGRQLMDRVKRRTVTELKKGGALLRILSADGMTVFSREGRLVETGFIIDTSHARGLVTGGGRTTAATAASFFGRVIKVSQDGPIELYQDGRLVYRFG